MTYYETLARREGVRSGRLLAGGLVRQGPFAQLVENIWNRFTGEPQATLATSR